MNTQTTSSTTHSRALLNRELDALGHSAGSDREGTACRVFVEIVRWLRTDGHGSIEINALDRRLSEKVKIHTIREAGRT